MSADAPKFDPAWIRRGNFVLGSVSHGHQDTFSIAVRKELTKTTSIKKHAGYPSRDLRHSIYWREGDVNYAEAQFFASISQHHAVLSIGVSVEKGDESVDHRTWDWPHVLKVVPRLVKDKLPALAEQLPRPLVIWLQPSLRAKQIEQGSRTFMFEERQWFERHIGKVAVEKIVQAIADADKNTELWVNLHIGYELSEADASGLTPAEFAERLRAFDAMRLFLKKPRKSKRR